MAACKAHIALSGETRERFELTACKTNATKKLPEIVTWKGLQNRYRRLQEKFDEGDRGQCRMSRFGSEVGEMEEMLALMMEDCDELGTEKNAKKDKEDNKEREKERLGAVIRARVMGGGSVE